MEWVILAGAYWLLSYEFLAGLFQLLRLKRRWMTISEWFWRLFKRKPWTRWVTLGVLIFLIYHLVFHGLGYGTQPTIPDVPDPVGVDPCDGSV